VARRAQEVRDQAGLESAAALVQAADPAVVAQAGRVEEVAAVVVVQAARKNV
jgi:hypothetical protein